MAVAVLLSRSRAGFFLVVFALFMFFQLSYMFFGKLPYSRKWVRRILFVILIVITFVFLYIGMDATIERFSLDRIFQEGRTQFWDNTLDAIKDFPLFGTGLGTYLSVYPAYEEGRLYGRLVHAHNDYLEYFMELGLVGFLFLFGGMGFLAVKSFLLWRKRRDPEVKGIGMGCFVALMVIGIHSLTDFNLHIPANILLFTVILSLGYVVSRVKHRKVPVE
jgi:O-antigen ligase